MAANSQVNNFLNSFSPSDEEPFKGDIRFGRNTITFQGTTLLLQNISKFEEYGLTFNYKISIRMMVIAGIFAIGGLFLIPFGLIGTAIGGFVIFSGIRERSKSNKLYGLTIQLNSGRSIFS